MKIRPITSASIATAVLGATTALAHPGHGGGEGPRGLTHYLGFHGLGIAVLLFVTVAIGLAARQSRGRGRRRL